MQGMKGMKGEMNKKKETNKLHYNGKYGRTIKLVAFEPHEVALETGQTNTLYALSRRNRCRLNSINLLSTFCLFTRRQGPKTQNDK